MTAKTWQLPIKTVSEANSSENRWAKKKRHDYQKKIIRLWSIQNRVSHTILPCIVKLVRLSPRMLDSDNLVMAFKWIRDYVADQIIQGLAAGRADGDPRITWEYDQQKCPITAIRIEIHPPTDHKSLDISHEYNQ